MNDEMKDGRPAVGSKVRMIAYPNGPIMEVMNSALGDEHDWEGVRNGILCEWEVDGEPHFEVFRPGQLVVVASPSVSGSLQ